MRDSFYKRYRPDVPLAQRVSGIRYFTQGQSEMERWIYRENYGGAESWSFRDRHRRALGIYRAIKNGDTPDPSRP